MPVTARFERLALWQHGGIRLRCAVVGLGTDFASSPHLDAARTEGHTLVGSPLYWTGMAVLLVVFIAFDLINNRRRPPQDRRSPVVLVLITVGIMVVGSLVGAVAFADDSDAAQPAVAQSESSSAKGSGDSGSKCDDSCTAAVKKRQEGFKAGDFGNSKSVTLPRKFRKKLDNAAAARPAARRASLGDWWNDPLGYNWCWAGFVQMSACYNHRPDIAEQTTKMVTVCGLTGLLAYVPGEGWMAISKGASACVLTAWAAKDF